MKLDPNEHFVHIYRNRADAYHRMVAVEDVDGNLPAAVRAVISPAGKRVLDVGTGTGRMPLLFAGEAASFTGLDLHHDMLRENAVQRDRAGGQWGLVRGDARVLPFPSGCIDIAMAGWALGHFRGWFGAEWQAQIGQALREMGRVVVPGGWLFVFETLTTGSLTPAPPTARLAEYYAWLEGEWGFTGHTLSTDYQFASVDEAVALSEFFFGPDLAAAIRRNGWARLPEWTGMWVKQVD